MGKLTEKNNGGNYRIINCAIRWSQVDSEQLQKAIDKLAEYENLGEMKDIKIALEKLISVSRTIKEGKYYCPKCNKEMNRKGHCISCGQKLY